jgi:hypothetical protein
MWPKLAVFDWLNARVLLTAKSMLGHVAAPWKSAEEAGGARNRGGDYREGLIVHIHVIICGTEDNRLTLDTPTRAVRC